MVPMVLLKPNLCFFVRFVLDTTKKQKKFKKTFCCYNCLDFAERQIFLSVRGIFPRFHSGEKECLKTSSLSRLRLDNNDVSQHSFSPSWNLGKMQLTLGKICLTANLDNYSNKILFHNPFFVKSFTFKYDVGEKIIDICKKIGKPYILDYCYSFDSIFISLGTFGSCNVLLSFIECMSFSFFLRWTRVQS